jgi:hypothetical protein
VLGLVLLDTRPERPQPPRPAPRRVPWNVSWRTVGGLAAAGGLVIGSSAVAVEVAEAAGVPTVEGGDGSRVSPRRWHAPPR